jgi:hypothetical protein
VDYAACLVKQPEAVGALPLRHHDVRTSGRGPEEAVPTAYRAAVCEQNRRHAALAPGTDNPNFVNQKVDFVFFHNSFLLMVNTLISTAFRNFRKMQTI